MQRDRDGNSERCRGTETGTVTDAEGQRREQ